MFQEEDFCEATLDMGKFQGREAVKNKDYLGAMNIYTAVHHYTFMLKCSCFQFNLPWTFEIASVVLVLYL